jgi:hypothetical protein
MATSVEYMELAIEELSAADETMNVRVWDDCTRQALVHAILAVAAAIRESTDQWTDPVRSSEP